METCREVPGDVAGGVTNVEWTLSVTKTVLKGWWTFFKPPSCNWLMAAQPIRGHTVESLEAELPSVYNGSHQAVAMTRAHILRTMVTCVWELRIRLITAAGAIAAACALTEENLCRCVRVCVGGGGGGAGCV